MDRDTRKKLFWSIGGILAVVTFCLVVIVGLPWRFAFERRVAEMKARGEPVCAADLKPPAVAAEDDGGPLLEAIWKDLEATSNLQAWRNAAALGPGNLPLDESQDLIRQEDTEKAAPASAAKAPATPVMTQRDKDKAESRTKLRQQVRDLHQLLVDQPDLLERFESALRRPVFHFKIEYKSPAWDIRMPHLGYCRQTTNLLVDLSLYYLALGEREKAQRCRLLLLRSPQSSKDDFGILLSCLVHCAQTRSVCNKLAQQLPLLTELELLALQRAAPNLKPWPIPWSKMMINARVMAIEAIELRGTDVEGLSTENDWWFCLIYYHTGLRYFDGLRCLKDYQNIVEGKPIPPEDELSFMGKRLMYTGGFFRSKYSLTPAGSSPVDSLHIGWQVEAARIRQFHLGLALELIKRQTGSYPADLRDIPLPQEDAEGKPMSYLVFPGGRGACLEFMDKARAKPVHFPLGEVDEKHRE